MEGQTLISKTDSLLVGTWKGTSLCQEKSSPCHDEIVVYYISKGIGLDNFDILASKIVNGKEEEMGKVTCKFKKTTNELISTSDNGGWTFNVNNKVINGTLVVQGRSFRIVKLTKEN